MCRFFIIGSNLLRVTSFFLGLTRALEVHESMTASLNNSCILLVLFFLVDKDQSARPLSSIIFHLDRIATMFLQWTPRALAMSFLDDELWALTTIVSNACFVTSLAPLLECLFSSKVFIIPTRTSCWTIVVFASKI